MSIHLRKRLPIHGVLFSDSHLALKLTQIVLLTSHVLDGSILDVGAKVYL